MGVRCNVPGGTVLRTCISRAVLMSARVLLPLSTGYRQYWKRCYPAFTGSTLTNSTVLSSWPIPPSAKPPSLTVPDTGRAAHRSLQTRRETSHIPDTARQTSPASKRRADGKSGWARFYIYVNKVHFSCHPKYILPADSACPDLSEESCAEPQ